MAATRKTSSKSLGKSEGGFKLPRLEAKTSAAKKAAVEIVGVFQDSSKKPEKSGKYGPLLEKFRKSEGFSAAPNALSLVWFGGKGTADHVLFAGLGAPGDLTEEKMRVLGGALWQKMNAEKLLHAVVSAESFFHKNFEKDVDPVRFLSAIAEGLILAAYQINSHKSQPKPAPHFTVTFTSKDKKLAAILGADLARISAVGEAITVTRDWSNLPSNIGTPEYFASESKRLAAEFGLKCKILTEADAEKEKMGLFLAVGQGAEREGRIVVLEYNPAGVKDPKTVCLVGKGVTFDSGGISIKPSLRMEDMKHDMTGAATLMGSILLAARWKVKSRVIAILAFTENMPDGHAIQPGNVITSRAGKTVEIINTDAEGRLILADVLDYAQDFNPDAIIDAATLTGAVSIALGRYCCAILGNDAELIEDLQIAGDVCGERIWQLPLYDEYFDDLKSDYADMKNSANDSYGGTIRGAIFMKQFIKKGVKWAHLDIAATAYSVPFPSYLPRKGASGAYVRSVAHFLERFGD